MSTLTNREIARSILRRYMADYTNQTTPPKTKGGFFAMLICDTGEVWLSETNNFNQTIVTFRNRSTSKANCVQEAIKRGSPIELWFLTQPNRFSAQALENELFECGLLADRKKPVRDGEGDLYVIRHRTTLDYFVIVNRQNIAQSTILNYFLKRLVAMSGQSRNKQLAQFVTDQADDILKEMNFDIMHLDHFSNREEEIEKRQHYINNCKYGKSLNLHL